MKYVWITVVSALVATLIIVSIMLIENISQREVELDNAINSASREALESVFLEYSTFNSKEEGDIALKERFEKKLNERIINGDENEKDSNLKVNVSYENVDSREGLLSVKVDEFFTHIGGEIGHITRNATVLVDEEAGKKQYSLSFLVNGRMYRNYILNEGDKVIIPPYYCDFWEDENGKKIDKDDIVTKDMVYKAGTN